MVMVSSERSKRKGQLWKKAVAHFSLCFVMGFFIGFAPSVTPLPAVAEARDHSWGVIALGKMANTISLILPAMLCVVVDKRRESDEVSAMLRRTGIMYRLVMYEENFTDSDAETDHQRKEALRHIKEHRLSGIVHFAPLSNVYYIGFFKELREIEAFGTWPVAVMSVNGEKVDMEGPVCDSSRLLGWHLREMNNDTGARLPRPPPIHDSNFAFNSSVLWDPERWGRPSSSRATTDQVDFLECSLPKRR